MLVSCLVPLASRSRDWGTTRSPRRISRRSRHMSRGAPRANRSWIVSRPLNAEDADTPPVIPGFVIERELGRGGMGVVYQARQPELARRVAIKVLTRGPSHDPAGRRRWLREARAMGRVRHPNVVRLHDAGEASGRLFLVLDLISGGSLKDRAVGPISPRIAAMILETVARAVGTIHASGMLHLDIKPSNILLDGPPGGRLEDAVPILADFGLARGGDDPNAGISARTGASLVPTGTPAFMAPEQIDGAADAIGPHTDVFALGCTLYALVTGRSPFQGASVVETLDLVRSRDPVPPRSLVSEVSRDLETILLKCLRRDVRAVCDGGRTGRRLAADAGRTDDPRTTAAAVGAGDQVVPAEAGGGGTPGPPRRDARALVHRPGDALAGFRRGTPPRGGGARPGGRGRSDGVARAVGDDRPADGHPALSRDGAGGSVGRDDKARQRSDEAPL